MPSSEHVFDVTKELVDGLRSERPPCVSYIDGWDQDVMDRLIPKDVQADMLRREIRRIEDRIRAMGFTP